MAEHRVRAWWHQAGRGCNVAGGQHYYVVCSCSANDTVEVPDAIADWVRAHHPYAIWYDHRGVPVAGFR